MGSYTAVAYKHNPDDFVARFCAGAVSEEDGTFSVGGLPVLCGADFVVVNILHFPSVTVDFALAEAERALPGLRERSEAVAVGLGGGRPDASTAFEEWTEHWIRAGALARGQQTVAKAMFGTIARNLV